MSFDLHFIARDIDPTPADIETWATGQPHVEVRSADGGGELSYEHPLTGVYASFRYGDGKVSFNLNYNRPHFFALEGIELASEFARHFEMLVDNPQAEGGPLPFDVAALTASWEEGNRNTIETFAALGTGSLPVMERTAATELWTYQRAYEKLKKGKYYDYFLPKLTPCLVDGRALRVAFLTEPTPYVLPPCDVSILKREGEMIFIWTQKVRESLAAYLVEYDDPNVPCPNAWLLTEHDTFETDLCDVWSEFHATVAPDIEVGMLSGIAMDGFVSTE